MDKNEIIKEIQRWILAEKSAGRNVDATLINRHLHRIVTQQDNSPRDEFNGLSSKQMHDIIYHPFGDRCVVQLNYLAKEQYEQIPLVRQVLFLLTAINEKELKLTKLGWLPLKIVAEVYRLGQPEWVIEEFNQKRINEYEASSVWMARIILEMLGWIKTRKGILSMTVKGKKAFSKPDAAANEILRFSLTGVGMHTFDGNKDDRVGNWGRAYSVWLLHKYGATWHTGLFYQEHYQKVFNDLNDYNSYEIRVLGRLFYWLGIVEEKRDKEGCPPFRNEYRKTDLLSMIFSFKK